MTICITCFIREVNASFGKPKPIAAISATTWAQKIKNCYTITLEIMHKESCKLTEPHWWITSIAAIILYPHESMVSFQSGKPSGMTGSELSSCTREMTIKRTNQIILYKKIKIIKKIEKGKMWDLKSGVWRTRTHSPHVSPLAIWSFRSGWLELFWHCF